VEVKVCKNDPAYLYYNHYIKYETWDVRLWIAGRCFMGGESDKSNGFSEAENGKSCTACHQFFDKKAECEGNYVPLTRDEEAILARMREVKAEVAAVKKRIREIEGISGFQIPREEQDRGKVRDDQALWLEQNQLMATLREEWQELDAKRKEAASFRMKILGHED
jgi:hypothetical protein